MKEKILKKHKIGKIFAIILIALAVIFFASIFFIPDGNQNRFAMSYLVGMVVFFGWIVYMFTFNQVVKSVNMLKKTDNLDVLDDCFDEQHFLAKSKIYYGNKALYSKKPLVIIPYTEIAWVYVKVTKMYGIITTSKTVQVRTRNGKEYGLYAKSDEFDWLLKNCIAKVNPNVLVGYNTQNQKAYKQIHKEYKMSKGN